MAAVNIVATYIKHLKQIGVYDQTTIIVTADHGNVDGEEAVPTRPINPIMLVKPALSLGGDNEPWRISRVATGHLDYHATIMDAVGGDPTPYGGIPIYNVQENDRESYFVKQVNEKLENVADTDIEWVEYAINGDAQDIDNWHPTGRVRKPIRPD